jgi:hypothetical protein
MVRAGGLEPPTSTVSRWRSSPELSAHCGRDRYVRGHEYSKSHPRCKPLRRRDPHANERQGFCVAQAGLSSSRLGRQAGTARGRLEDKPAYAETAETTPRRAGCPRSKDSVCPLSRSSGWASSPVVPRRRSLVGFSLPMMYNRSKRRGGEAFAPAGTSEYYRTCSFPWRLR